MKLARILWCIASFYLLILLLIYVLVLDAPEVSGPARLEYILDNWGIYQLQFKAELLIGVFLCLASLLFALEFRRAEFVVIAVGQLIYAMAFPLVLGVYPEASAQTSLGISQAANTLVTVGMITSMAGFLGLHWNLRILPKWLHMIAYVLAVTAFSSFTLAFLGQITHLSAQKSMLAVTLLYLINGIYGIVIRKNSFQDRNEVE